jgi:hypothetical protein
MVRLAFKQSAHKVSSVKQGMDVFSEMTVR